MFSPGWFEPLSVVPCLSWTSAAPCYTKGVLSHAVDWKTLETQLNENSAYQRLLRHDTDYLNKFTTHYTFGVVDGVGGEEEGVVVNGMYVML